MSMTDLNRPTTEPGGKRMSHTSFQMIGNVSCDREFSGICECCGLAICEGYQHYDGEDCKLCLSCENELRNANPDAFTDPAE